MTTRTQIETLRTEAGSAGDDKMVRICDAALELGEESTAWRECSRAIAESQAQQAPATVTLTSYNMGGEATAADYDAWVRYVNEHIDERAGFTVQVDADRFGTAGDDRISDADDAQREEIKEALRSLWDSWCAGEDRAYGYAFTWSASWGAENTTRGRADTLEAATEAARAAYGSRQGARIRVYDSANETVLRETLTLRHSDASLVWVAQP